IASLGDPGVAWDNHGRAFFGGVVPGNDPAHNKATSGDIVVARFDNPDGADGPASSWNRDGLRYVGTTVVADASSAPNGGGRSNDKPALEVDHTGTSCDGNVYFAWTRFAGDGTSAIYLARSND